MLYRVRCLIWQIEASSAAEAKQKVCDLVRAHTEPGATSIRFFLRLR